MFKSRRREEVGINSFNKPRSHWMDMIPDFNLNFFHRISDVFRKVKCIMEFLFDWEKCFVNQSEWEEVSGYC